MHPETPSTRRGLCFSPIPLLLLVVTFFLAAPADGQIFAVEPRAKVVGKYRKHLREFQGSQVIVGEVKSGFKLSEGRILIQATNELFLPDSSNPTAVPYRWRGGERVAVSKKQVLKIPRNHVNNVRYFMRDQTLAGLGEEYSDRLRQIEELETQRDAHPRNSPEWMTVQVNLVSNLERLCFWLENSLYSRAAKKQSKRLAKERKAARDLTNRKRLDEALASIRVVPTPDKLEKASEEITGGRIAFRVQESLHIRVIAEDTIPVETTTSLLELAETLIADFRARHVDPYVGEDFRDFIPDRIFHEFYLGPSNLRHRERFYTDYYGLSWGPGKEQRLRATGQFGRYGKYQIHLDYWQKDRLDYQAAVIHRLGHSLASYHFNAGGRLTPPWIAEGLGLGLSYAYLGRNTVNCQEGRRNRRYGSVDGGGAERDLATSVSAHMNRLALDRGAPIPDLIRKELYQLGEADLAKAWSVLTYMQQKEGKKGQEWLRAACKVSRDINRWREATEKIFELGGEDAFAVLEARWREYASAR